MASLVKELPDGTPTEESKDINDLKNMVKALQDDLAGLRSGAAAPPAPAADAAPPAEGDAAAAAAPAAAAGMKASTFYKTVDGNGLALMCIGFGTFTFFAFLCSVDDTGFSSAGAGKNFGIHFLVDMLIWGCGVGLLIAGIAQGIQGDSLGFTSYVFHAAVLGSVGYNIEDLLQNAGSSLYLTSWLLYAAFYINLVFTVLAFRAAVVFGVLYFSVAIMFLAVGLEFSQKLDDSVNDPTDIAGWRIAGVTCLNVAMQCFVLCIPVMTGKLGFLFAIPNPFAAAPPAPPAAEDGVVEPQTKLKLVDANGLALAIIGFTLFSFFVFLCNIDGTYWGNQAAPTDPKTNHPGIHMLSGICHWGSALGLGVAGIFQFFNGDHLGFTSYIFHAAILGTTGWWINDLLSGFGVSYRIWTYFFLCASYVDFIFAFMAFKVAKMFGGLYFVVAVMFFIVGLNWSSMLDDSETDPLSHGGAYGGGLLCLLCAVLCFYAFVPLMTGRGILV